VKIKLYINLDSAQRVCISAKLHCLCPHRNFKFHLCPKSHMCVYILFQLRGYCCYNNTML